MSLDAGAHGSWNVYKSIKREYADQICSEQRVEQRDKKGRISVVWEKISSHAANHLLDCETNNTLAPRSSVYGILWSRNTRNVHKSRRMKKVTGSAQGRIGFEKFC